MSTGPERFECRSCGRTGTPADVVTGWSVSRRPRATGDTGARSEEIDALCPDCARQALRDLEGRLDP